MEKWAEEDIENGNVILYNEDKLAEEIVTEYGNQEEEEIIPVEHFF